MPYLGAMNSPGFNLAVQRLAGSWNIACAVLRAKAPQVLSWADARLEEGLGLSLPPAERVLASFPQESLDAACWRCGQTTGAGEVTSSGCAACAGRRSALDGVVRLGPYGEPLRTWVMQIKQGERWEEMAIALGRRIGEAVETRAGEVGAEGTGAEGTGEEGQRFLVVPVAMPLRRRLARGIDHACALATGVGEALDAPVSPLLRRAAGPVQTGLARSRRRREGRRRWHLAAWAREIDLRGISVVLVDDVRTTGTTLEAAARQLRRAQPLSVTAAVIAVADEPGRGRNTTPCDADPQG